MKKILFLFIVCQFTSIYGQITNLVIGGQDANEGQFPWVADLHYTFNESNIGRLCGGTLIAPEWVLTAGHCVDFDTNPQINLSNLRFNSINSTGPINPNGGEIRTVSEVFIHPLYQSQNIDLALVKLSSPVTSITPALLPDLTDEDLYAIENDILVAGWGSTVQSNGSMGSTILQWVMSKIKACTGSPGGQPTDTDVYFCIGYTDGEQATGAAIGDSGGPSFIMENNDAKILGVVSHGDGEYTDLNKPGRFVKVLNYLSWINSVMNSLGLEDNSSGSISVFSKENRLFVDNNYKEIAISVYDNVGKQVLSTKTNTTNASETIDITNLSSGLYIAKLQTSSGAILTKKFMKP